MSAGTISLGALSFVGEGLVRPECVLATRDGSLWTADWRGGIVRTYPNGKQNGVFATNLDFDFKPNGFAIKSDGSFLIAHLGDEGGLWDLSIGGEASPVCREVEGRVLPSCNFVLLDSAGTIWLTISTMREPRALGYRPDVDDGFIVRIDERGAAIVADGLGYTNELAFSADESFLYVNETFGRRMSRFPVQADGSLGEKEVVTTFGFGIYPDGLAFDVEDHLWVTSIVSNRVIRVAPDGSQTTMIDDSDADHIAWCEEAYLAGEMGRPHLDNVKGTVLKNISSLAFGGSDLRTAYMGCLLGDQITRFESPVAGRPPVHWEFA